LREAKKFVYDRRREGGVDDPTTRETFSSGRREPRQWEDCVSLVRDRLAAFTRQDLWNILGLPLVAVLMVVYFSSQSEFFLTESNFQNIGRNIAAIGILAIAQAFVIVLGEIDISVGSIVGLTSVTTALAVEQFGLAGAIVAPLTGLAVGVVNGAIVTQFVVHSVIVTIGTLTAARGLAFALTNGTPIVIDFPPAITWLGDGEVGPFPAPFVVMLVVFAAAGFVFRWTVFGPMLYATGGNEEAARLAGINVKRVKFAAFCISGTLAGLVGLMLTGRISSGQPTLGEGLELQAIAAAVIGGMALTGGRGTIAGVAFGVIVLTLLQNGLDITNVSSFWQQFVSGVVILLAVMLDRLRARRPRAGQRLRLKEPEEPLGTAPAKGGAP
jgi:ribose transport system permease protein